MFRLATRTPAVALATAGLLVFGLACSGGGERTPITNVVVLSIDTLNRRAVRGFDAEAPAHPVMDGLVSESLRFTAAHSTSSWTLPAHVSMHTGLYPDRGISDPDRIRPINEHETKNVIVSGAPRLATELRDAGYETVAFTEGGFVDRRFGFGEGFDLYDGFVGTKSMRAGLALPRGGEPPATDSEAMFDRALAYLDARQEGDPPFFMFLHTFGVHDYFMVHPWAKQAVADAALRDSNFYRDCVRSEVEGTPRDWQVLEGLYRAEIDNMDHALEAVVEALRRTPGGGQTLLLVLSDHGEGFEPERGRIGHGVRLHEDLVRIPFFVRGPGIAPGASDVPVSLVDVLPTVLDFVGVSVPDAAEGVSLAPLLRGGAGPPDRILLAMEGKWLFSDLRKPRPASVAVLQGRHWYISSPGMEELYDMRRDPGQTDNLAASRDGLGSLRAIAYSRLGEGRRREETQAHRLFLGNDSNGDGVLDLREMEALVLAVFSATDDELRYAMNELASRDADGDGEWSPDELAAVLADFPLARRLDWPEDLTEELRSLGYLD